MAPTTATSESKNRPITEDSLPKRRVKAGTSPFDTPSIAALSPELFSRATAAVRDFRYDAVDMANRPRMTAMPDEPVRLNAAARDAIAAISERIPRAPWIDSALSFALYVDRIAASATPVTLMGRPIESTGAWRNHVNDLAALALIREWETHGFTQHVEAGLPTAAEAETIALEGLRVLERLGTHPPLSDLHHYLAFDDPLLGTLERDVPGPGRLWRRLLRAWFAEFAWTAFHVLQAPIRITARLDDGFIREFAALCWQHRDLAAELFSNKEEINDKKG